MIDAKEREVLAKGMKVLWIIWGAMLASLGIYILVAHLAGDQIKIQEFPPDVFSLLRNVLYIVALIELAIIPFIRKITLKSIKVPQSSNQNIPGTGNHPATAKYATVMIISLAIAESIAIYGLVLYFLAKDSQSLYLLTAISAVAMIVYRPKMDELEKLLILASENHG